jgi:hypothetical protein
MSEAGELLSDVRALRRKARSDRHAYWLPLLFFGLAIAASAPLYVEHVVALSTDLNQTNALYELAVDSRVHAYWSVVLLSGALLTAWWYRREGARTGIEGRIGPPLVAATLFLVAYTVLAALPGTTTVLSRLWFRDYDALLVIAVGLLALARQERSPGLWAVAAAFAGAAGLAFVPDLTANLAPHLGGPAAASRYEQLPALVLPALVLLTGGLVAGLRSRRAR